MRPVGVTLFPSSPFRNFQRRVLHRLFPILGQQFHVHPKRHLVLPPTARRGTLHEEYGRGKQDFAVGHFVAQRRFLAACRARGDDGDGDRHGRSPFEAVAGRVSHGLTNRSEHFDHDGQKEKEKPGDRTANQSYRSRITIRVRYSDGETYHP